MIVMLKKSTLEDKSFTIENKIDLLVEKMHFVDTRINKLEAMVIYKVGGEVAENE